VLNLVYHPEEEHRLKGFRNKELKRIFGPEKQKGAKDGCMKSLNGELHNLFYFFLNIIRRPNQEGEHG
jgi:hypothetical protein